MVTIHKVVASLPDPLTANAIYAVRAGEGFDLYIADSTGAIAHPLNGAGGTSFVLGAISLPNDADAEAYSVANPNVAVFSRGES